MSDTGIRYTHCRAPNCGVELTHEAEHADGLHSITISGDEGCFHRFNRWRLESRHHASVEWSVDYVLGYASVEWSVAIDEWLEAGAP